MTLQIVRRKICLFSLLIVLNFGGATPTQESARDGSARIMKYEEDGLSSKILTGASRPSSQNIPQSPDQYGQGSEQQAEGAQSPNNYNGGGVVPDIYVQIVEAIEKLVGRMDKLDHRLRTVESIVYFITNKEKEKPKEQGNCPANFTKIESIKGKCFHISSFNKIPAVYDWKSAAAECRKLGGRLVEMISYDDFLRIVQFLSKYTNTRNSISTDFWTGGINPGLIWIWAESGQQVDMDRRFWNENDNSSNAPGCLKLSYSNRLNTLFFKASPCSHPHNYLCEVLDNTVARALSIFEQNLVLADATDFNNITSKIITPVL